MNNVNGNILRLGVFSTFSGAGAVVGARQLKENYPSKIRELPENTPLKAGEQERVHIGYFGAPSNVQLENDRPLYFADLETAQGYAVSRQGRVYRIEADRPYSITDLAEQRFEGPFAPLHPEFLKTARVTIHPDHEVTEETKVGYFASAKRAAKEYFKQETQDVRQRVDDFFNRKEVELPPSLEYDLVSQQLMHAFYSQKESSQSI